MDRIGDSGSLGEGSIPSRCTKKARFNGLFQFIEKMSFQRFNLQKALNLILNFLFRFPFNNIYGYFPYQDA